jgi:type I restriction enzyme S subunit
MVTDKLGKFISEVSIRNKNGSVVDVFSVTNSQGFVKSTEYFNKEVFSKDVTNYKIVAENEFAYNPSRINVGSIDYLKQGIKVAISPLYVVFRCSKELNEEYLKVFLKSPVGNTRIRAKTKGAVRDTLSFGSLCEIKIPILPINEQRNIANLLSKTEKLIAQRKESMRLLDEFLKSTFLDMFGDPGMNPFNWDLRKLENSFLVKPLIGSMVPAIETGTIPIVRVGEIGSKKINFDKCKFSNLNSSDIEKYRLKDGDILLARAIGSESHLGKASIYNNVGNTVVYDSHVMRLRLDSKIIHPEFLYTFLQTQGGRSRFMRKAGQTSVQFNINSKQISDIDIPVPPIELQTQFAQIVEKTETLKTHYQESLQELENLYSSLSQKAFSGR